MSELQTENISPFTGLPIIPKDKKPEVSPLTGLPITNRAVRDGVLGNVLGQAASGNVNLLDQMSYKDYESYKSYGVAVLPGGDWDEQRAQNQWRLEKWASGLTKAGVTAATSFAENTVGLVVGLGSVASGGSFFDNSFGRGLDKVNEFMAEALPNYYTREEQNATVLGGALYANFWADKVANGVGYVVGSLATDVALAYLTGGTSLAGTAARYAAKFGGVLSKAQKAQAVSNVYKLTNAVQQGGKVADILTDGARASTKFKSLRGARTAYGRAESGFISALGESNVEARQAKNETLAILKQQYALQNGIEEDEIPANILAEMEETATTAGNVVFGINLPTVGLTNMITIGRMLGPGYKRSLQKAAQERAKKSIFNIGVGKEADEFVDLGLQGNFAKRAFVKGARKYGDNFTSAISESAQEATQFFASKYAQDYYTNKYFGRAEGIDGMLDSAMYGLRETFGSKEGLESALLGGIIGGGTVSVRNLNRMRKGEQSLYDIKTKNTQAVLDIVNSTNGVADAVERAKSADTSNKLSQAMDKLIKVASDPTVDKATRDRAHKEFKDLQYQLVANEAFTLLEFGREDILMQQLDDAKDMDETEFKKAFGYDVNQPLPEGGKAAIVDKIKDRIKEHKQIKEKIEELAPRLERTTGLPRSLMSKEQREQEDQLIEANNFYRRALYNRASAISGYNTRSNSIGKDMQKLASDNGVSLNRTAMEDYEFDQLEIEFEDNDEVRVQDGGKVKGKLVEELQKVYKDLQSKNPLAAKEFAVLAQDYLHLVAERQATVNSFEALTGDQGLERSEYIRKRQEAMEAEAEKKKAEAEANQVINNAETAKDIENNLPNNASKEQKEIAKVKAKKLQKEAIKRAKKYEGKTLDELREIDRDALEKLPDGAIELAALDIAINKAKKQTAQPAQPVAEPEVEEAFKPENVGGVQIVSANSREFVINGKVFYNYSSDPLGAINRDENGNVVSVTLVDENLESRTFRNEETADALAYAILTGEYNQPSVPTLTESIEEDVAIRTEVAIESAEKLERKAKLPQNAPEVSPAEAIKAQLFDLHSDLEEVVELISERHAILREQGVTLKKNRMRDEKIRVLTSVQNEIEKRIIARKNELKKLTIERKNELAKLKADEVTKQDAEERLQKLQVEIAKLDDEIAELQALELRLEEGGVQTQALVNVKQARRKKQAAKNKLTKELLTIQNEEIDSTRDARQTAERLAGKAQEQANEGEGANTTPGPGGEGRVVTDRQSRTEQAADELEKAERNASGELRDQGAGQARGVKPDQVIIQAPAIQAPAPTVTDKKADIERRRQEELKRFEGRRANSIVKFNPDGENTELTEREIEEVENLINTAKEKGLSVDRTQKLLQTNGFVHSVTNSPTAFREFLKARLSGELNNKVNGEFLNTINAKYDAELAALEGTTAGTFTPTTPYGTPKGPELTTASTQSAEAIPAQQLRPQSGLDIAVLPSNFETAETSPSSVYVNEDGSLPMSSPASQTVGGSPIIIEDGDLYDFNDDFVGKTVTFEVREDTDWAKEQSNLGWKNAPIYVVLNGRRIGLLQGYNERTGKGTARESIYNLYKQGKTPTATTTGRGAFSFLNAIDPDTGQKSFTNPLEEFESPVFAIITSEAKQIRYTIGEGATASEAELSKMQSDLDEQASKLDRDKLIEGQVVMVVKTPNGKYTTYPVSTQNLSTESVKLAMKLMSEGRTVELLDLVGFNADPFNWGSIAQGKPSFLYYVEAGNFFVFHSDSAKQLVSINSQELQKAMSGQKFSFGFVLGPTDPDSDKFDKDEKRKDHASIGKNIVNDLSALLSRKKYQVSKESVNNPTARIVNPETGQSQNYQEYIFGNGLARVDTRNNKGTVFHGLQIKFGGVKAEGGPVNTKATETTTYEKPVTPAKETVQRTEGKKEGRKRPAAKSTQVVSLSELGAQPSAEVMKQLMEEMQGNPVQDLASLVGQSAPKSSGIKVLNQKELNDLIDLGDELNNQCK
jgi:hypothetical protein